MGKQDERPFSRRGLVRNKRIREYARKLISDFGVKASSPTQKMRELSGGNAQKLIVAREMSLDTAGAHLLRADARHRHRRHGIHSRPHGQKARFGRGGAAGLLGADGDHEPVGSIYVIYEGRINGEFKRDSMDDKALGLLMVGGAVNHE